MFIWDFTTDLVLGQILDWLYGQMIGFLGEFFAMMGNMGAELFEMAWVQAVVLFFSYLAWWSPSSNAALKLSREKPALRIPP
jgi:hypothetical protein